jgi:hypothetical protein
MKSCDPGSYLLFIDPDRSQKLTIDPDRLVQILTDSVLVWFGFFGSIYLLSSTNSGYMAAARLKYL